MKDGTAIPFRLNVGSTDNTDDTRSKAAGAAHSCAAFGISVNSITGYNNWLAFGETTKEGRDGRPRSTVEVAELAGTTDVFFTRWWIWVDGGYICEWGSGANDPVGDVTLESPSTTILIQISAGQNEGEGGVIHPPPSKRVKIHHLDITPLEALAAASGVLVQAEYTSFNQVLNTGPDLDIDYFTYITPNEGAHYEQREITRYSTIASKVLFKETTITAAKNFDINILLEIS